MMKTKLITSLIEVLLGLGLVIAACVGALDTFWSGMGGALMAVGTVFLFRYVRLQRNPAYREEYETETNDERNKFLRMKAWSWSGYLFVLLAASGTIIFKLVGREDLMMFCSACVCIVVVLYWLCYMVLNTKY